MTPLGRGSIIVGLGLFVGKRGETEKMDGNKIQSRKGVRYGYKLHNPDLENVVDPNLI